MFAISIAKALSHPYYALCSLVPMSAITLTPPSFPREIEYLLPCVVSQLLSPGPFVDNQPRQTQCLTAQ